MTAEKAPLIPGTEMEAYGLSVSEISSLGGNKETDERGIRAFRQGLAEGAHGELNPHFPDELRNHPQYAIGTSTVKLSQEMRSTA